MTASTPPGAMAETGIDATDRRSAGTRGSAPMGNQSAMSSSQRECEQENRSQMLPRILVVSPRLDVGGTEVHLIRILPELRRAGLDVSIYPLVRGGVLEPQLIASGVPVLGTNRGNSRFARITRAGYSLRQAVVRLQPDIVHFFLPESYIVGSLALAGLPNLIRVMSRRSLSKYQFRHPLIFRVERLLHGTVDKLIANSSAVAAELIEECKNPNKVRVIHNGYAVGPLPDAEVRLARRRQLGISQDEFVIITIANLIAYKGHSELLCAIGQAQEMLRSPWRLLVVGGDKGIRSNLIRQARELGIAENVDWLGERLDAQDLIDAADLGILASYEEGFSNSLIEKMAHGLPVIATRAGGNIDAVVDGESGVIVPVRDADALGAAIVKMYEDPSLRRRLGNNARLRIERLFSLNDCVKKYLNLYQGLKCDATEVPDGALSQVTNGAIASSEKRPLLIAYWGTSGALPKFTLDLAKVASSQQDIRCTFSVSRSNELFEMFSFLNNDLFPVSTFSGKLGAIRKCHSIVAIVRNLAERMRQDGTETFISLMPHVWSPFAALAIRRAGLKHVAIVHDVLRHPGDRSALVNRWLLTEAQLADHVVTLSSSVAQQLIEMKLVSENNISVLFHPDLIYRDRKMFAPPTGALRILFLGRILPYKGLDLFIGAAEQLRREGVPLEVGVFGRGNIDEKQLQRLRKLEARVGNRWIKHDEIGDIISSYDLLIASHTEASQSGVIAVAYGAGIPVVATPVGGLTEQVMHRKTGLIASSVTAEAIAREIKSVAISDSLLSDLRSGILATQSDRSMRRFFCELSKLAANF